MSTVDEAGAPGCIRQYLDVIESPAPQRGRVGLLERNDVGAAPLELRGDVGEVPAMTIGTDQ